MQRRICTELAKLEKFLRYINERLSINAHKSGSSRLSRFFISHCMPRCVGCSTCYFFLSGFECVGDKRETRSELPLQQISLFRRARAFRERDESLSRSEILLRCAHCALLITWLAVVAHLQLEPEISFTLKEKTCCKVFWLRFWKINKTKADFLRRKLKVKW